MRGVAYRAGCRRLLMATGRMRTGTAAGMTAMAPSTAPEAMLANGTLDRWPREWPQPSVNMDSVTTTVAVREPLHQPVIDSPTARNVNRCLKRVTHQREKQHP